MSLTLREFITKKVGLEEEEWEILEPHLRRRVLQKGESIRFKDDIWNEVMFIEEGMVRSYIINDEGKEFTRQFYFNSPESSVANLFVLDLTSLTLQTPSIRGFEVLQDCIVTVVPGEILYHLYETDKNWERVGRKMAELAYIDMERFYHEMLTLTPAQRYRRLEKNMQSLLCRVSQYHVASYLGITPVSLSRIRKKMVKVT